METEMQKDKIEEVPRGPVLKKANTLELREFSLPLNPELSYSVAIIAMTRAGKSFLLEEILNRYFSKKISILMTQSPNAEIYKKGFFKLNDTIKMDDYYPRMLKLCKKINKGSDNRYGFCFILDDVIGKRSDPELKKLHTTGRNQGLSCCITGQTMTILDTTARSNTNIIALGKLGNDSEKEKVMKSFLSHLFPAGMYLYDKLNQYDEWTRDHKFIIIDNLNNEIYLTKVK